jgi:N-acyl amino acid synthase of PEP-CTERM/exosortase system
MILFPELDRVQARSPEPANGFPTRKTPVSLPLFRSYCGRALSGVPADIARLRFEVYCLECAFLQSETFHEGLEHDQYDTHAMHFAAYTLEERVIGAVRLVQPKDGKPYPFQQYCKPFDGLELPPDGEAAEISRLVVRKGHRRRRADSLLGVPGRDDLEQEWYDHEHWRRAQGRRGDERDSPMLLFGLYREMYRHSLRSGIRYWYAAMERSLIRSLERLGFAFEAIGPQADYYGAVTPCLLDLRAMEERLHNTNPALARWFMQRPLGLAA